MNTRLKLSSVFLAALLLSGCVSTSVLVEEKLDLGTGVTVTHATAPIVLYRDNSAYAAHARDYVYVGPVEINRMGDYSYYLWLGIWSTVSDEERSYQRDGFESITLFADGEPRYRFESVALDAGIHRRFRTCLRQAGGIRGRRLLPGHHRPDSRHCQRP